MSSVLPDPTLCLALGVDPQQHSTASRLTHHKGRPVIARQLDSGYPAIAEVVSSTRKELVELLARRHIELRRTV
jgi:hypothetical protein